MIWYLFNLNILSTDEYTTDTFATPIDVETKEENTTTKDVFKDNDSDVLSQSTSENDEGISNKRKFTFVDEDQSSESYKYAKSLKNLPFKKRYLKLQKIQI
ncbi:hypothetical protein A0H76_2068 [Hepatospora eriocheir]|uniref:Uncharacterized protein n=1 Tax=Hepatospora eriocheir TaxID=1081669 RepID=A0A1X0QFX9_9MICR|nr:hypothetical protein A0H76_2068 [Hepatospora eriocheir]